MIDRPAGGAGWGMESGVVRVLMERKISESSVLKRSEVGLGSRRRSRSH